MATVDEMIRGWYAIASELGVSEKTARKLARWGRECRCPVFEDYIGPFIRRSEMARWRIDQTLPAGIRARMKLSAQKSTDVPSTTK